MGWVGGGEKGLLPIPERFVNANLLIYPPTDNNGVDLIYIGTQIDTQTQENNPILLLFFFGGGYSVMCPLTAPPVCFICVVY